MEERREERTRSKGYNPMFLMSRGMAGGIEDHRASFKKSEGPGL